MVKLNRSSNQLRLQVLEQTEIYISETMTETLRSLITYTFIKWLMLNDKKPEL